MGISIDLSGKKALITGATRGIGKSIADEFIEAGAKVILTGTKQSEIDFLNSENENEDIKAKFISNRKIIDFDYIPKKYVEKFNKNIKKILN